MYTQLRRAERQHLYNDKVNRNEEVTCSFCQRVMNWESAVVHLAVHYCVSVPALPKQHRNHWVA